MEITRTGFFYKGGWNRFSVHWLKFKCFTCTNCFSGFGIKSGNHVVADVLVCKIRSSGLRADFFSDVMLCYGFVVVCCAPKLSL